jgi:hypothetical protein
MRSERGMGTGDPGVPSYGSNGLQESSGGRIGAGITNVRSPLTEYRRVPDLLFSKVICRIEGVVTDLTRQADRKRGRDYTPRQTCGHGR